MDKVIKRRTAARSWATRASKRVLELYSKDLENIDKASLKDALSDLMKKLDALDEVQLLVELELKDEDIDTDIQEAEEFRNKINQLKINGQKTLDKLCVLSDEDDKLSVVTSRSSCGNNAIAKLPKLTLPTFHGDPTQWQSFWDQFDVNINQSELPDVTKFSYLLSLLKGDAKASIQGLSLTSDHYNSACIILKERFGRTEKIIFTHIQEMLNLSIPKSNNITDLWKVYNDLQIHVRSLEALDINGSQYGIILTPIVLSRLPSDMRMEWARVGEGNESDLAFLLDFLLKEIQRCERSQTYVQEKPQHTNRTQRFTTAALTTGSNRLVCNICSKGHGTDKCFQLTKATLPERKTCLFENKLCFRCLSNDHFAKGCKCFCASCGRKHHVLLCEPKLTSEIKYKEHERVSSFDNVVMPGENQSRITSKPSVGNKGAVGNLSHNHVSKSVNIVQNNNEQGVILQTAEIVVVGKNSEISATVLFDLGSDRSYVSNKFVQRLGPAWVRSDCVKYAAFGTNKASNSAVRNVYNINLQGVDSLESAEVTEIPVICAPLFQRNVSNVCLERCGNVKFARDYSNGQSVEIDILIGLDNYWRFMQPGIKFIADGLVAQKSKFGWIISGCTDIPTYSNIQAVSHQLLTTTDLADSVLKNFWELESIGITIDSQSKVLEKNSVLQNFSETIVFKDDRYQVTLPWKNNYQILIDNKNIAYRRLMNLTHKLERDPTLRDNYHKVISDMEREHIIEEVPKIAKCQPTSGLVYYLPHRPVVKESSLTTKIRPVFDASAPGANGVSLNDCLETGPSLLPSLVDILLRFRRWPIAISADITKAFLQVGVQIQDRDVHRFLWNDHGIIKTMRFLRVPFGNCSSPFLLNATIRHHLLKFENSHAVEELQHNLYVDDWLSGADTEEEACILFQKAHEIMSEANMSLAKCSTNSTQVSLKFSELDCKYSEVLSTKVLGLHWNTQLDTFGFKGIEIPSEVVVTKRVILSLLARIYDPLGFLSPYLNVAKMILQDVWVLKLDWDQPVSGTIQQKYLEWLKGLAVIQGWSISRCYAPVKWSDLKAIEVHGFGDASEKGYGSVVYLCVPLASGKIQSSFVISRSKVAPLTRITIPRLELLAALLTARLVAFVVDVLKLQQPKCICYSDSKVALCWIQGDSSRWKMFVANRVIEIQQLTNSYSWCYCPSADNPADLISRGTKAEDLLGSDLWLKGPVWLEDLSRLPNYDQNDVGHSDEVVKEGKSASVTLIQNKVDEVIEFERYSSFTKALRVIGWIKRFVSNASGRQVIRGELSYDELIRAKVLVFCLVQQREYAKEFIPLKRGDSVSSHSFIAKLQPFLDENGLIRVKTRLEFSNLTFEEKYPILLPKCYVSFLLVRFYHHIMHHAGVATMMTRIRSEYWIVGLRYLAKKVKRFCVWCQRQDSQKCQQPAPPLPQDRVKQAPPFSITGIDHAGPLYCCDSPGKKFYILLFTCAVVRALHLELVDSLSLVDTMLAIRRFIARRGMPSIIYSDNAKSFKAAEKKIKTQFGPLAPKWKFIAPCSPWWGGWWERLVRNVKSALKKSVCKQSLTRTELETVIHEVEAFTNSRPLSPVYDEPNDCNPITPSHFLIGRSACHPISESSKPLSSPAELVERKEFFEQLMNKLWSVWSSEYIRNLPLLKPSKAMGDLKIGSMVLIHEENTPRLQWPIGVVIQLHEGRDGIVRAVDVKTAKGDFTRPIQKIHELELYDGEVKN